MKFQQCASVSVSNRFSIKVEFYPGCLQGDPEHNGQTGKSMKRNAAGMK